MQLGDWKNTGTSLIQDQPPVLLKSTIKCNYGGVDIKITDCGQKCEPENIDTTGMPVPGVKKVDFDIKIEIVKDTFVPLGINDFQNKAENDKIKFKLIITGKGVNNWTFEIRTSNSLVYQCFSNTNELEEVVIVGKGNGGQKKQETPNESVPMERFWPAGTYIIEWDGFDNNEIYDSALMTNEEGFVASIIGQAEQMQKKYTMEDPFMFKNTEVNWVDVKIDKKTKRIDTTLRVDLRDGGAKGLNCYTHTEDETMLNGESNPFNGIRTTVCDWDKIPKSVKDYNKKEPIKTRTKTFEQLKDLVIDGLAHYWGRNSKRGKNVMLSGEPYEVYVNAVDSSKNALNALPLVYNTNGDWMRSGNPGGSYSDNNLDDDALGALPDLGVIQRLSYNVGYIYYSNGWGYSYEENERQNFQETAAHELGHELLQAYGGTAFSYQHKGSSYYFPQDTKPTKENEPILDYHRDKMPETSGENYPTSGEVDLMKYYNNDRIKDKLRTIAAEKDVLGLFWLTKLKVK
jgi:hypothetical protein